MTNKPGFSHHRQTIRAQWLVAGTAVFLFALKLYAWHLTGSVAILTDAMESTVNVMTGFIGLYSLYLSAKPRDKDHPYGHGKVEFLSSAIEGLLISAAGVLIVLDSIGHLRNAAHIEKLNQGIQWIVFSALVNLIVGTYVRQLGKRLRSLPLMAGGNHLLSDTLTTAGIIVGLLVLQATGKVWIDAFVAILFSILIIISGIRILRKSLAGIMDESDETLLQEMVELLENNRRDNWVDLHNLRIIKYGTILHLDCHLTVPWYLNVHEAHSEVDALQNLVRETYGDQVELFVHTDGCLDFSCTVCQKPDCSKRQSAMVTRMQWTVANISANTKHRADQ